jgi:hypothetical protein
MLLTELSLKNLPKALLKSKLALFKVFSSNNLMHLLTKETEQRLGNNHKRTAWLPLQRFFLKSDFFKKYDY